MCRLRPGVVHLGNEVRQWNGVAELLGTGGWRGRDDDRQCVRHAANRSALCQMQGSPGPSFRRRPPTERPAVLYERRFARISAKTGLKKPEFSGNQTSRDAV